MRYPALIECEPSAAGVIFPDLPGCVAAAETMDQALVDAADVLRDWVAVAPKKTGGTCPLRVRWRISTCRRAVP